MVKKIAGPVKAVKENYTIRTIQKENSISTDEKVLEFNVRQFFFKSSYF